MHMKDCLRCRAKPNFAIPKIDMKSKVQINSEKNSPKTKEKKSEINPLLFNKTYKDYDKSLESCESSVNYTESCNESIDQSSTNYSNLQMNEDVIIISEDSSECSVKNPKRDKKLTNEDDDGIKYIGVIGKKRQRDKTKKKISEIEVITLSSTEEI